MNMMIVMLITVVMMMVAVMPRIDQQGHGGGRTRQDSKILIMMLVVAINMPQVNDVCTCERVMPVLYSWRVQYVYSSQSVYMCINHPG